MIDDFEKYWQQKFESFEVQPNNSLWQKVDNALFERQAQSLFKQYVIYPNARVWRNIVFTLWWKKFLRFSPSHFNLYYFLSSLILGVSIILFYQTNQHSYDNYFSRSTQNKKINTTRDLMAQIAQPAYYYEEKIFTNADKGNNTHTSSIFLTHNRVEGRSNDSLLSYIQIRESTLPSSEMDGVFFNRHVRSSLVKNTASFGFYFSIPQVQHQFKYVLSPEIKKDPYFNLLTSYAYSSYVCYRYSFNLFNFETGLMFQSTKQLYSYNNPLISYDTSLTMHINDMSYYQYSTIQIINLDTLLLTGDTVWINYTDSTLVAIFDTTYQTEIKESRIDRRASNYFSYKTVEIPLLLGYTQHLERFSITFKAGISLAYILTTWGMLPSFSDNQGIIPLQKNYFRTFNVNTLTALEAQYNINEQWSVSFMPMYKRTLSALTTSELPVSLKAHSWAIFLGLKYHLK